MKFLYTLLILILSSSQIHAQIQRCHTTEYINTLNEIDINLKNRINATFNAAKQHSESLGSLRSTNAPSKIYRIPVVFHVVYNTDDENISDALLISQLDVLNTDFRKLNADTTNHREVFIDRASDIGFEFHFATIDPDGNPTNGITRTETTVTDFSGGGFFPDVDEIDKVKFSSTNGKDAWDTDLYMNIWVCNSGGSILGLAYPPENAPNWEGSEAPENHGKWGVVLSHTIVGFNNPLAPGGAGDADQGRTLVHEAGHFFGLRHIWGDSGFFGTVDCDLDKDDGIDDTPHMGNNTQGSCNFSKNTCSNNSAEDPDEPDMPENYMDYSLESCQNMFTQGQADLMQSMAVIGRPNLPHLIEDNIFNFTVGTYISINGVTMLIEEETVITIKEGDLVMFLNENDGFEYTSTVSGDFAAGSDASVSANGELFVDWAISINEKIKSDNNISIFPNPTNNTFSFKNKSGKKISEIKIINIEGKIVKDIQINSKNKVDISNLVEGLYFVSFYLNEKLVTVKKINIIK